MSRYSQKYAARRGYVAKARNSGARELVKAGSVQGRTSTYWYSSHHDGFVANQEITYWQTNSKFRLQLVSVFVDLKYLLNDDDDSSR